MQDSARIFYLHVLPLVFCLLFDCMCDFSLLVVLKDLEMDFSLSMLQQENSQIIFSSRRRNIIRKCEITEIISFTYA